LPFNHIIDEKEFQHVIKQLNKIQSISYDDLLKLKFNPFDFNVNNDNDDELNKHYGLNNLNDSCDYYCSDLFNDKFDKPNFKSNFSLIHFNSRSLNKNFDSITDYLHTLNNNFSVLAFSESWFNDKTPTNLLNIDGYRLISSDRFGKKGGGVALYVSTDLHFKLRTDLQLPASQEYESLFIEIETEPKNIIIGVLYRPPDSNTHPFIENLSATTEQISKENLPTFICGDFNINLLNTSSHCDTSDFLDSFFSSSMYPLIDRPTRVSTKTCSLIDHIYTNILDAKLSPGVLFNDITDHFPIFVLTNKSNNNDKHNKGKTHFTKRNINKTNIDSFKAELNHLNWNDIMSNSCANDSYNEFINIFTELYNKHFPKVTKKINKRQQSKPWISSGIIKSIKTRNNLYKTFLKHPNDTNKTKYIKYRNKLTHLIKIANKNYYTNKFNLYKTNIKNTWKTINSVLGKSSRPPNPSYFHDGSTKLSDPGCISNRFNKFFAEIGPKLASQIQSNSSFSDFLNDPQPNTIFLHPTHDAEICDIVNLFKNGKSAGYDDTVHPSSNRSSTPSPNPWPISSICPCLLVHSLLPSRLPRLFLSSKKMIPTLSPITVPSLCCPASPKSLNALSITG
jgi:hypothetical protein